MNFHNLFLVLIVVLACCSPSENTSQNISSKEKVDRSLHKDSVIEVIHADTIYYVAHRSDSVRIKVEFPEQIKGEILLLHGWNLKPEELCQKTNLCEKAKNEGYILIIPDFGKTTYHWETYPQTRKDWRKFPSRQWMYDTLFPFLQSKSLLEDKNRNFVYGVSTGGRGAALFALEKPNIFKVAACLSADFDHSKLKNEPINNGFYGSIDKFPERWNGRDNIHNRAAEFKSALFLAHGTKDKICEVSQTELFIKELEAKNPNLSVKSIIDPNGDHTYIWWNSMTDSVLTFFSKF